MRNIWTIARREYRHYFVTPSAYVVAFSILLLLGIIFYFSLLAASLQQAPPGAEIVINPLISLLLFFTPAITMRTLAEEQRMGTIELLLTAPVRDWELVIGKWFGAFLFLLSITAVTWIYPLVLNQLVEPGIDQGPLLTGYFGIVLICAALVAIGVAVSSFFSNQFAALFATWAIFLTLWILGFPAQNSTGWVAEVLRYLDFDDHYFGTFFRGILDLRDIIYYASITALGLFLGSVSVESRRWR